MSLQAQWWVTSKKISDTKAYVPFYTQGVVWIINPQTMQKTGEIQSQPNTLTMILVLNQLWVFFAMANIIYVLPK